jgi:hypothetical protein
MLTGTKYSTGKIIGRIMITQLTIEDAGEFAFYHNHGNGRRTRNVRLDDRRVIAWDGEGMSLSGDDRPQHYVLFGCSADRDAPLIGKDLHSGELLRYICDIGRRFPCSVHVGYGFRYDANMIVRHLPLRCLMELKERGSCLYSYAGSNYRIAWLPGKRFQVTRYEGNKRVTVAIDDVISFFSSSFIKATESILSDELTDEDREVIAHGKAERGRNVWDDLKDVRHYWHREIGLMERLMVRFRAVMFRAGFMLRNWYGPGALSSYLIRSHGIKSHIVNGPPDIPREVHSASKHAYAGGRFELFSMGRFTGPIYSLDINSAYPYAISQAPSLGEGFWQHVENPTSIAYFGVYRVRFHASGAGPFEPRAMPLFHRDHKGSITFPNVNHGWYWSPEASAVAGLPGVEISEGWEWVPATPDLRPFAFLRDMFSERMRIGKANVLSMPYKLGPNSLYGKLAQRVGFTTDAKGMHHAPSSHCLPLAGWVTSYTRAMLLNAIRQIPTEQLIGVETDGVYTTYDPALLRGVTIGRELGEWDVSNYNEMLYLQSGIYHRRQGSDWLQPKSRGLDVASVSLPTVREYLRHCDAGDFPTLNVKMRPRFVGLTAAAAGKAPLKVRHCRWEPGERDLEPGGKGKRVHIPAVCPACQEGKSAWDAPHRLIVRSRSMGDMSRPHWLPWEGGRQYEDNENAEMLSEIEGDMTP